jgi:serine/threonine-protein kinase
MALRRAATAILGLGALGAAAGAVLAGGTSGARHAEARRAADEARNAVRVAVAASAHEVAEEVAAAVTVPQFRSALTDRVDTFTLDDLFQTEDWWAPHRARALVLTGPQGIFMSRNLPSAGPGPADLAARAATARGVAAVARVNGDVYLAAAAPVGIAEPPGRVLVLGRAVDTALLDAWSAQVHAGLSLSDGHGQLRAGGAPQPTRPGALVGHESEPVVLDPEEGWLATAVDLAPGVWLWVARPMVASGGGKAVPLWGLAGALALAALAVALIRPKRVATAGGASDAPRDASAQPAVEPTLALRSTVAATSTVGTPPAGHGVASGGKRASVNLPTMIAPTDAQVFGRYTVLDKLGSGGMCDLYTAALTGPEGFQRTFVLKRLRPELAMNRAAIDQFIDEAKLGSTLVHSNIVPVFDFGRVGDGFFIAQEYIVGRNIAQLCERHQDRLGEPLDVPTVFYIAHETLQALAYAHDKTNDDGVPLQIVHRDISPGNILVSRLGEVKLIDFGIVKAADRVSKTDLGNVKGNASFMAPEQARGLAVDRRADLFSLGLVMYRAMAGESFYPGATTAEVFYGAASGPTAEHFERIDQLPPIAARILKKALMPDPNDRYASAEEFAADIVGYIPAGAKAALSTLINALFGSELKSGGGPGGSNTKLPQLG